MDILDDIKESELSDIANLNVNLPGDIVRTIHDLFQNAYPYIAGMKQVVLLCELGDYETRRKAVKQFDEVLEIIRRHYHGKDSRINRTF